MVASGLTIRMSQVTPGRFGRRTRALAYLQPVVMSLAVVAFILVRGDAVAVCESQTGP